MSHFDLRYRLAFSNITHQCKKHRAGLGSCRELCTHRACRVRLMRALFPCACLCVALWRCTHAKEVWHVALRLSWRGIQKEKCNRHPAFLFLTWTLTACVCVWISPCARTFVCHVLAARRGMAGVVRASLQLSFMRAFVSVKLLFLLSAARCYNPWPRPAKSASPSSRSIVVGLCVSVAKQQLARGHTELCVMPSCRGWALSQTHTHTVKKKWYTRPYI